MIEIPAQTRLVQLLQTGEGWPPPGSPYLDLMRAELTADHISIASIGIPGVLRDPDYVAETIRRAPNLTDRQRQHRLDLVVARQENLRDRFAGATGATALHSLRVVMPRTLLAGCARVAPDRIDAQRQRLFDAVDEGWDIRLTGERRARRFLGPGVLTNIVFRGIPEAADRAVYEDVGRPAPGQPHERWSTEFNNYFHSRSVHNLLVASAVHGDEVRRLLALQ